MVTGPTEAQHGNELLHFGTPVLVLPAAHAKIADYVVREVLRYTP